MSALTEIFGSDACFQFVGRISSHSWDNSSDAMVNHLTSEACVQARNERIDFLH